MDIVLTTPFGWLSLHFHNNEIVSSILHTKAPRSSAVDAKIQQQWQKKLDAWLQGQDINWPINLKQGTPFQQKVWRQMLKIPMGQTWSYTQLAEKVGNISAVRAVATACARNPIVLLIPCHRVVGKSGALTGYSAAGGIKTKQAILDYEQRTISKVA